MCPLFNNDSGSSFLSSDSQAPTKYFRKISKRKTNSSINYIIHSLYNIASLGSGPFPGIIDIFGVGGGLLEYRASLLAGHGFATLALAYCSFEDLPKKFDTIDLDYFEEALCYMLQHTKVLVMSFIILFRSCREGVTLHSPVPSALILFYSSFTDISFEDFLGFKYSTFSVRWIKIADFIVKFM